MQGIVGGVKSNYTDYCIFIRLGAIPLIVLFTPEHVDFHMKLEKGFLPFFKKYLLGDRHMKIIIPIIIVIICIYFIRLLKKLNIKYSKSKKIFAYQKVTLLFLFIVSYLSPFYIIYEILSYFNKTEGAFAAYTYFIFMIGYLMFIINYTSPKNKQDFGE